MRKTLTYSSLAITSVLVILAFVTAKTYTQLGIAIILYPLLAYFAFKIFPLNTFSVRLKKPKVIKQTVCKPAENEPVVMDIDRRAFLKLIGGTGLSIFIFSLLGQRVERLLFGRSDSGNALIGNPVKDEPSPVKDSLTDGYKISEIDDNNTITYYGFIDNTGAWFIMREDIDANSFRYSKGESDFPGNWRNREHLKYDYFHNLF
jgi:hypothetical protein